MFWVYLILAIVIALAGLVAILLYQPVTITADVTRRQMRFHWACARYTGPLPGGSGEGRVHLCGFALPPRSKSTAKPIEPAPAKTKPTRRARSSGRLFWRWLRNSEIRLAVTREGASVARGAARSVEVSLRRAELCFADPALNGMLAGFRAATAWSNPPRWSVNWSGENNFQVQLRLRPHRLAKALVLSFVRLPYRALLRESRARRNRIQNRQRRKR